MTDESIEQETDEDLFSCPLCEDKDTEVADLRSQRDELLERIGDVERGVWGMDELMRFAGALR